MPPAHTVADRGATLVEVAMLLALVALVAAVAVGDVADTIRGVFLELEASYGPPN